MSAYLPDDVPRDLQQRGPSLNNLGRGNRSVARPVVQVVGKSRAFTAALVAAGVVLSGCGSADGGDETTTSPTAAQTPGNPWDLPIEQRPALFDPCAEIPVEAIEEGVGGPVQPIEDYRIDRPGEVLSCGFESEEVHVSLLGTWKSYEEYASDASLIIGENGWSGGGRNVLKMSEVSDTSSRTCLNLYFTSRGTVWVKVIMSRALRVFKGQRSVAACDALDELSASLVTYIPEGDFR